MHFIVDKMNDKLPQMSPFLASLSIMTFTSFTLSSPTVWGLESDRLLLILSMSLVCVFSSVTLNVNWIFTAFGQLTSFVMTLTFLNQINDSKSVFLKLTLITFLFHLCVLASCFYFEYENKRTFIDFNRNKTI